jgi:hypothetical protein
VSSNYLNQCVVCHEARLIEVGGMCEQCKTDKARGYQVRSLAGRCLNGFERDHGTLFHAVSLDPAKMGRAACGAKPGKRSAGWSEWGIDEEVTCPRCIKRLGRKEE